MSIGAIASTQQQYPQIRNDFQSLGQALKNGNLSAAQTAFSNIQQDQQTSGAQPPANSQFATDFSALGQALQSGNLSGAQQAFSTLQTNMQSRQAQGGGQGGGGQGGEGGQNSTSSTDNSQKTVAYESTTTNANGTLSVTTTYTDGTSSSSTYPNPNPTVSQNPLSSNSGQLATLLQAQQQANGI